MPREPQVLGERPGERLNAALFLALPIHALADRGSGDRSARIPFRLPDHDLGGGRHADRAVDVVGVDIIELRARGVDAIDHGQRHVGAGVPGLRQPDVFPRGGARRIQL